MSEYKYVGKSIPRIDALAKVTGKAKFTNDYKLARMLYAKVLRSPYPHAKIMRIDTSRAEKLPGVRAVLTAKDVPDHRWSSTTIEDEYILPRDNIVRKVDDRIAAVAAETVETAEEAIDLIEVEYEELPRVLTIDEGWSKNPPAVLQPDLYSFEVYPAMRAAFKWNPKELKKLERPNVAQHFKVRTGDVDKGFEEADVIVENTFETVRGHHCQMEPHGWIAWEDEDGVINEITSSQSMWLDRLGLSRVFRCPEEKFRLYSPWTGGGYGGKFGVKEGDPIAILLSQKCGGRPVKFILTRRETFLVTECRMPMKTRIKDGYKKDGTLVAREIEMIGDLGAYSGGGALLIKNAAFGAVGTYRMPNFKLDSYGVLTNLPKGSLLRGVGTPEVTWAIEQQMDIVAEKLGINPVEIRTKNMLRKGDMDACTQCMMSTAAKECTEKVAEEIGMEEKIAQESGPWKIGRGIAIGNKYTIAGLGAAVTVKVIGEGIIEVRHNAAGMGQGTHSALAQMAAEEFDLPIDRIRVIRGDTSTTPYDAGSFSSRSIFHTGNALVKACDDAKQQMFAIAAPKLGVPANELETKNGKIFRKSLPSVSISIADLFTPNKIIAMNGSEIVGKGSFISTIVLEDENGHSERMVSYYAYCAFGVEAAINEETGEVKLLRVVGAADMGQPINPKMCEGQIEGGAGMGIGLAVHEEMKFDNGIPLNPTYADYKIPTVMEIPIGDNMKSELVWDHHDEGPFGAKGVGEATLSAIAPAISNAIYNAVGVRLHKQPLSREMVWKAIQEKRAMGKG